MKLTLIYTHYPPHPKRIIKRKWISFYVFPDKRFFLSKRLVFFDNFHFFCINSHNLKGTYCIIYIFAAKYLKGGMWLNSVVWWASKQRSWFLWWLPLMLQCFPCKNLPKCCYLFDKWLNLLWQPIQTQIEFRYFLLFHSCALLKFRQTFAWYIFDA